jgi:hypothetical protein
LIDLGAWERNSWDLKHKSKNLLVWKKKGQRQVSAACSNKAPAFVIPFFSTLTWKVGHILEL